QQPRREVAVGGETREAGGQVGADDAGNEEDEPEEAEAVQRRDGALRLHRVHRLEPRPEVRAEGEQPRHVAETEMDIEDGCGRHGGFLSSLKAAWCVLRLAMLRIAAQDEDHWFGGRGVVERGAGGSGESKDARCLFARGMPSYGLADGFPVSRRNGSSGPTGMYS